jgi:hypothetical protein
MKPGCMLLIFGFTPTLEPPEEEEEGKHDIWTRLSVTLKLLLKLPPKKKNETRKLQL